MPHHRVVHRDPFAYCAHPHIVRLADGAWLAVFNRSVRRPFILHPSALPVPDEPLVGAAAVHELLDGWRMLIQNGAVHPEWMRLPRARRDTIDAVLD